MSGSQNLLLGGSPQAVPVDPFFYSVTSLLHGDGTNGGQNNTFLDSSTNNFTITRNGNTTQGSFSPFSQTGWSNYFDGTGDYLTFPNNTAFAFGTGAFTIEFWVNGPLNNDKFFLSGRAAIGTMHITTGGAGGSTAGALRYVGSSTITSGSAVVTNDTWNHCAIVRDGSNNITLYVNGASVGTGTDTTNYTTTSGTWYIASNDVSAPANTLTAYLSNLRIVKGTAVYTAAFTPPTVPLTAISGTSLLTCQANRFLDASSNAFAITRNGDVSVQPFSPFNPITAYSTSAVGGSGYFDGSGDTLTIPSSAQNQFGSGDFTIECWWYFSGSTVTTGQHLFFRRTTVAPIGLILGINSSKLNLLAGDSGTSTWEVDISSSTTLVPNTWYHFAATRNGSTWRIFVNGVQEGSATASFTIAEEGADISMGTLITGYLSGWRALKGTAQYTGNFTVPTAPPTAIANTCLLLNFTNGAIFDNAADADYETVGNAQISTSVKKYGTGSIYLDGTGDWLTTASRPIVALTGDFTIECWVYPTSVATTYQGIYSTTGTSSSDIQVQLNTNQIRLSSYTAEIAKGGALQANTWTHIAVCRAAGVVKLFQNGTVVASAANTTAWVAGTAVIGNVFANSYPLTGYIDDLRISNGVARYLYNFTPPTAEFPNIGGTVTLTADPYYDYTTLLLPGNGTNGAQNNTFLDSSTNAFTITRNGNTTQGTFSPFSQTGWSSFFPGTSGSYLSFANSSLLNIGSGDFTAECWIYPTTKNNNTIFYKGPVTGPNYDYFLGWDGTTFTVIYGGTTSAAVTDTVQLNQWNHVALVRNTANSTLRVYINGTQTYSATYSGTYASTSGGAIGGTPTLTNTYAFNGYISNVRIAQSAIYTANFTPSTTPLTAITNTSLLTCQSNRFIDNSTNAFAITRNGDVSVQAFSPFNPTAAWSAATNGGSGYFDGSGDYLTAVSSADWEFTADFTIECWVYPSTLSSTQRIISHGGTSGPDSWLIQTNGTALRFFYGAFPNYFEAASALTVGQWQHIAIVRSSTTITIYVNGVSKATATVSGTIGSSSYGIAVGSNTYISYPDYYVGYLANLRVVKGTAVYTAAFTPPTAPLTAITNTKLLLNFTNAGIYDATSKNDLETVGNAQISTTQSKFGGSSMYFDGNDDWLYAPAGQNWELGSGDFTVEFWLNPSDRTAGDAIFSKGNLTSVGNEVYVLQWYPTNLLAFFSGGGLGTPVVVTTTQLSTGIWYHVAVTRYNGTTRIFVNGILEASSTTSYTIAQGGPFYVGAGWYDPTTRDLGGYLQDFRLTKGIARYTSNFTPPTTAFLTL